jgi:hypothetical protein
MRGQEQMSSDHGVYGSIALRAWRFATEECVSPREAWRKAVAEHYSDPWQRKNAMTHTCPACAFLGLCGKGLVKGIKSGDYTTSNKSAEYAIKAVELLEADQSLAQ